MQETIEKSFENWFPKKPTAQGTIEYLVILAIVVVISLTVVSLMVGSTNSVSGINSGESKIYWQTQPVAIENVAIDSEGDGKLVLKNNAGGRIEIIEVLVDGVPVQFDDTYLALSEKLVIHLEDVASCIDHGSYSIEIRYISENGLEKRVSGQMPLVVDCDDDIAALFFDAEVYLKSPSNNGYGTFDQNLVFTVSGTDVNYCRLISDDISGEYEIGGEIFGEKYFFVEELTGRGTSYEWNVECCNSRLECAMNDKNFLFTIPNNAPSVTLVSPNGGTFSGSVPVELLIQDIDGGVSELTATVYYSDNPGDFDNLVNTVDLIEECFSNDYNFLDEKTCYVDWPISDPTFTGNWYVDVKITDGVDTVELSTPQVTIVGCVQLGTSQISISSNTSLCYGDYTINDSTGTGVINFAANGITLNCNGATIKGSGSYGIYAPRSNIKIKNCNILNYNTSVWIRGSHNLMHRGSYSREDTKSGTGVYFYHDGSDNTYDNNIFDVKIENRVNGVYFYEVQTSCTYTSYAWNYNIKNSLISNNNYGLYYGRCMALRGLNIHSTSFKNSSNWAIYLPISNNTSFSGDNNIMNSSNGIFLGSNHIFDGYNLKQFDVGGTVMAVKSNNQIKNMDLSGPNSIAVKIEGSHNLIQDVNVSRIGSKSGTGIYFYHNGSDNTYDNNVVRVVSENRSNGVYFYEEQTSCTYTSYSHNFLIKDSNINNNSYGLYYGRCMWVDKLSLENNKFLNNSSWAINLPRSNNINYTTDNNIAGSSNGLYLGNNHVFDSMDLKQFNIPGTVLALESGNVVRKMDLSGANNLSLYFGGNHNLIEDVNVSREGSKAGTGIQFYLTGKENQYDNNVLRVDASNRIRGIMFYEYETSGSYRGYTHQFNIIDSNFIGNTYALDNERVISNYDTNIYGNRFVSSSTRAIDMPYSYGTVLKNNDFISNSSNIILTTSYDSNSNYWSNHSTCPDPYSFTGGVDNTPVCSEIN